MSTDDAEYYYRASQIVVALFLFAYLAWLHHSLFDKALIDAPETLSLGQLKRALIWGKVIYRINRGSPKQAEIEDRMRRAVSELRRRRGE